MLYPNLSRAVEGYLLEVGASGRSPNTLRNYRNELKRLIRWGGDCPIDEVTSEYLEKYMFYLKNDFRIIRIATTEVKPRKLSQKSIYNAWGALSGFCKWFSREYQLDNPFHLQPVKFYTKPILPLKEDEVEQLLHACKVVPKFPAHLASYEASRTTCKRDRAIVLTLLDTGIRVGELCDINVGDLDMTTGRITVTGKGEKTRFVYLGKVARQAVWSYHAERFPKENPSKDEPLFADKDDIHRITRYGVRMLVQRLGKRGGVNGVHPHKFRHTFAVEFLRNGGNVFELQQLLGHTDLEMVKRYVMLAQIDLEVVARKASPADHWRLR